MSCSVRYYIADLSLYLCHYSVCDSTGSAIEAISFSFFTFGWSLLMTRLDMPQQGHQPMKLEVPSNDYTKMVEVFNGAANANMAFWPLQDSILLYVIYPKILFFKTRVLHWNNNKAVNSLCFCKSWGMGLEKWNHSNSDGCNVWPSLILQLNHVLSPYIVCLQTLE